MPTMLANEINMIGVNNEAFIVKYSNSGGTNIKHIPSTLAIRPVPATIQRPGVPPGIRNGLSISGFVKRSTITETNMSAYITK